MSEDLSCISCRKSKAPLTCGLCNESVCKSCVQKLDSETFSLMPDIPAELSHHYYCQHCYDETISPALNQYEETLAAAKDVLVYFTTQRKAIPLIKKSREIYTVNDRIDRDDTILRLGFLAAMNGFNAIMDVEVIADKNREGRDSYSHIRWRGVGWGAQVDAERQAMQDQRDKQYRF